MGQNSSPNHPECKLHCQFTTKLTPCDISFTGFSFTSRMTSPTSNFPESIAAPSGNIFFILGTPLEGSSSGTSFSLSTLNPKPLLPFTRSTSKVLSGKE